MEYFYLRILTIILPLHRHTAASPRIGVFVQRAAVMDVLWGVREGVVYLEAILRTPGVFHQVPFSHIVHIRVHAVEPGKAILIFAAGIGRGLESKPVAGIFEGIRLGIFRCPDGPAGNLRQVHLTMNRWTAGAEAPPSRRIDRLLHAPITGISRSVAASDYALWIAIRLVVMATRIVHFETANLRRFT